MPTIVTREQWGAAPPQPRTQWPTGQPTGHTIHWEGSGGQTDHGNCAAEVRSIQQFHFRQGYADIAYNWAVCNHGVIFQCREVEHFQSAAQNQGNPVRAAICYLGGPNFPFTKAAKKAIAWLIQNAPALKSRLYAIGHRDEPSCKTACPGDVIEEWIIKGGYKKAATPVKQPKPTPPRKPLPSKGVRHPVLAEGSVGPAVMELQRKLNGISHAGLNVDGDFGPKTKTAVENFQRFFKLGVDGIAGPFTWGLIDYIAAVKGIH